MTLTPQQQPRKVKWGNWLRLRSNPDQRPVPEPERLRFVRVGDENQGIRARRRVRGRAGRGRMAPHGPTAEPGPVKWEESGVRGDAFPVPAPGIPATFAPWEA
jgi:hypothetical protein